MKSISLLGVGAMGSRIAGNLLRAGFDVTLWNRTAAATENLCRRGATAADSPAAAARRGEIVISLVSDDAAARAVWLDSARGACRGLGAGAIAIECSTTTPGWSRELGAAVAARSADYLEAPLLGSRPQAEAAQLIHLVGGDADVFERARPVLATSAAALHRVGDIGAAMAAKLAVNTLFASQVAALGETLGALVRSGLDRDAALALLAELPTTSPALKGITGLIAASDFAPLFPIDLVVKDLGYYAGMAAALQAPTPLALAAQDVFVDAQRAAMGGDNIAGVARLYL